MEALSQLSNEEVLSVHVSRSFTVKPRSTSNIRVVLHAAGKVHGSFRIFRTYGFGDKELKFKVLDTTETVRPQPVLLDLGTVVKDASFEFTAGKSGDYLLVFENDPGFSDSNSQKEIQLTYEITDSAIKSTEDATRFAGDGKPTTS